MVGGSQREERLEVLLPNGGNGAEGGRLLCLDTRRQPQPHSLGVGFEHLILATAMGNIRDVIPFPRTVGQMLH